MSPAATAFWTFLMTVRNFERSDELAAFSFDVLAGALAARGEADGVLLGFGRGCHVWV